MKVTDFRTVLVAPVEVVMVNSTSRVLPAEMPDRLPHPTVGACSTEPVTVKVLLVPTGIVHLYDAMPFTGCEPTASNRQSSLFEGGCGTIGQVFSLPSAGFVGNTEITACTGSGVTCTLNGGLGMPW